MSAPEVLSRTDRDGGWIETLQPEVRAEAARNVRILVEHPARIDRHVAAPDALHQGVMLGCRQRTRIAHLDDQVFGFRRRIGKLPLAPALICCGVVEVEGVAVHSVTAR